MAKRIKKSKIAITSQKSKKTQENSTAIKAIETGVFVIVILFLFFSIYDAGGKAGEFLKKILTSLFGAGAYFVPFISVFWFYTFILSMKNEAFKLKASFAGVFLAFVSAFGHIGSNAVPVDIGLKNLKEICEKSQMFEYGGIFGTYIAEALRVLTGNVFSSILIVFVEILSIGIMFSKIVIFVLEKLLEFFKGRKKEKTSKIFRVPGVKIDKRTPKPDGELELPDIFNKDKDNDVVIEKFADPKEKEKKNDDASKKETQPIIKTISSTDEEAIKKEPKLTQKEIDTVSNELEEAKKDSVALEYKFPKIDFLNKADKRSDGMTPQQMSENAKNLVNILHEFNVEAEVISVQEGPAVTRYEIKPEVGVKISKIMGLSEDIALRMAAKGIRIAPIPGKTVIGVEIANKKVMPVFVRDVITSQEFLSHKSSLAFALGKDIAGTTIVGDISKMPHCLIAGATGSGKSVCINTLITSILYKSNPSEVRLIMIDPKVVELSVYNGIPHLLIPVVTDPRKAAGALNWAVMEMLNRYNLFAKANVRDLESYNEYLEENGEEKLPKIVVIVDELADLMMASPKEVEEYICRLAQLARAAGMHLVIATQRPSVDVITGLIKANIPSRIAFAVSSAVDSRTILDVSGAEKLLGKGDMLYAPVGESKPIRVQGALITDKEVEKIVTFLKSNAKPDYDDSVLSHIESNAAKDVSNASMTDTEESNDADVMLEQCVEFVVEIGEASVSKLQRRFKLGYSRAARIVDQMEERGIVGPSEGSKPRQVLIDKEQYAQMMVSNPQWLK